jgi:DNA mismatch repair protein MutL
VGGLSGGAVAVTAVPAGLAPGDVEATLLGVAHAPEAGEGPAGLRRALVEAAAAASACKAAVKMHEPLSAEEMQQLVSELFAAEQPYACPHGRPIVLKLADGDLERRFGRR